MKKIIKKTSKDTKWLQALGKNIDRLIKEKGHKSPYEFWIQEIGDEVSRATLNYILVGKVDPKATTLKKIADALKIKLNDLFNF